MRHADVAAAGASASLHVKPSFENEIKQKNVVRTTSGRLPNDVRTGRRPDVFPTTSGRRPDHVRTMSGRRPDVVRTTRWRSRKFSRKFVEKFDFAHRSGAVARSGSRELRSVKLPVSYEAW